MLCSPTYPGLLIVAVAVVLLKYFTSVNVVLSLVIVPLNKS